jgi:hypothetical protein
VEEEDDEPEEGTINEVEDGDSESVLFSDVDGSDEEEEPEELFIIIGVSAVLFSAVDDIFAAVVVLLSFFHLGSDGERICIVCLGEGSGI